MIVVKTGNINIDIVENVIKFAQIIQKIIMILYVKTLKLINVF